MTSRHDYNELMSFGDLFIFATFVPCYSACSRLRTTGSAPRRRIEHVNHFESSVPYNALASQVAELVLPGRTMHSVWSRCRTLFISAQATMVESGNIGKNDRSHHQDAARHDTVPHLSKTDNRSCLLEITNSTGRVDRFCATRYSRYNCIVLYPSHDAS
jgi:hypothetical protein